MAIDLVEEHAGVSPQSIDRPDWIDLGANAFECRVLICEEEEGGYSAHALRLPGVVSEGETEDEAIANIKDAFAAAIAVYRQSGRAIPLTRLSDERPPKSKERWILVNA